MPSEKLTDNEQVKQFFKNLNHPLLKEINALREIILLTDENIGEHIKWNSPAYYYKGEMKAFDPKTYKRDIAVINLHRKEQILLIFPTGAIVNDTTGLLEGDYKDGRRIITISNLDYILKKEKDLRWVINEWMKAIEK